MQILKALKVLLEGLHFPTNKLCVDPIYLGGTLQNDYIY